MYSINSIDKYPKSLYPCNVINSGCVIREKYMFDVGISFDRN